MFREIGTLNLATDLNFHFGGKSTLIFPLLRDNVESLLKSILEAGGIVTEKMMEGKKKIAETTNNEEGTPKKE